MGAGCLFHSHPQLSRSLSIRNRGVFVVQDSGGVLNSCALLLPGSPLVSLAGRSHRAAALHFARLARGSQVWQAIGTKPK
jgi:hypothetical protein